MSTKFGVKVPCLYEEDEFEVIVVARRSNYVRWENGLAQLLPDKTKVIPMDNTAQGIYTIGDIREAIKNNDT
jgi:hypothetical protein